MSTSSSEYRVVDPADPSVDLFRRLNDVAFRRQLEASSDTYMIEGWTALERVTAAGGDILATLVDERRVGRLDDMAVPGDVLAATAGDLAAIVGFQLHRGVVAVARRPAPVTVDEIPEDVDVVATEAVNDHVNLGAIARAAAALGAGALLCDPTTADPWYRRTVRTSMGTIAALRVVRADAWPSPLRDLQRRGWTVVATSPKGEVAVEELELDGPSVVVLGAEGAGLSEMVLDVADVVVRIPMTAGVDSLNVGQAAAVILNRVRECAVRRARSSRG